MCVPLLNIIIMIRNRRIEYFWGNLISQIVVYLVVLFMISGISVRHNVEMYNISNYYSAIAHHISVTTRARAYLKGTPGYNLRRKVNNGLCNDVFPDLIVAPKTEKDVSKIIQISRYYNVPISVRSGGHSFLCTSTKSGM